MAKRSQSHHPKKSTSAASLPWVLWTPIVLLIIVGPLIFFQREVWVLDGMTLLFPLDPTVFSWLPDLLGNHRIVFSPKISSLVLGIQSFLPVLGLSVLALMVRRAAPGGVGLKTFIALVTCALVYRYALPGTPATNLWELIAYLGILFPIFCSLAPLYVWIIISISLALCLSFPILRPVLFWSAISFGSAKAISFIFVHRLRPSRRNRQALLTFGLETTGLFILVLWILLSILKWSIPTENLGAAPDLYLAFLGGALCVLVTWLSPWRTSHWLTLGIFCQGLFFFQGLSYPVLLVCAFLLVHLLEIGLNALEKVCPPRILKIFPYLMILVISLVLIYEARNSTSSRQISSEWLKPSRAIGNQPAIVIGKGLPFLAQFHRQKFVSFDPIILEKSETAWSEFMDREKVEIIVVDLPYLKDFWADKIRDGMPARFVNDSMLSRLLLYGGKEMKTKTLDINPVTGFKSEQVQDSINFFIIRRSSPSR